MRIVNVIPISKGISRETLSYFSTTEIDNGAIVSIPMRNRTVSAIVVSSEDAGNLKSEIKSSGFSLKKISASKTQNILSKEFMESAKECADFFCSSTGAVLNALTPKAILEFSKKIGSPSTASMKRIHEKLVLQCEDEERFGHYKSLIREEFARKSSVFMCLPTVEDIKNVKESLEKGIEKFTFVLHGAMPKQTFISEWNRILEEPHPVLIIATGSNFPIYRRDIGCIVIEKESSRAFKIKSRPYLDIRTFAEMFSKKISSRLVFGDSMLRTETISRYKNSELQEFSSLKFRSLSTADQKIIDMKVYKTDSEEKFRIISDDLQDLIKTNKERSENMYIYGARKGLAPSTVCGDCGTIVSCSSCSTPLVLIKNRNGNFFACQKCGEKKSADEKCANCGSWKLVMLGIGIDKIEEELAQKYPELKIFKMDKDTVKTHKRASEIAEKFYATPGSILIGTEMALSYLNKKIDNTAVVSIDSLFSIPDFRTKERIFHIILNMRALARKKFLLQTRNFEEKVLDHALKGNLMDFFREEISERKIFDYPPFSLFIKITSQGEKEAVVKKMRELEKSLEGYEVGIFPAFTPLIKGKYVMNALIKIKPEKWVDKELLKKLTALPPQFAIKVDPETIL